MRELASSNAKLRAELLACRRRPRSSSSSGRVQLTAGEAATLAAGRTVWGPLAWMSSREGYRFFQAPTSTSLIRSGVQAVLQATDPCFGVAAGTAPVEGEDPCP